jgi:hypothetical protein
MRALGLLALMMFPVVAGCGSGGGSREPVVVIVSPATVSLGPGMSHQFVATVSGTTDSSVTWRLEDGTPQTEIDANGRFTAGTIGVAHISAVSTVDPTASGTATITIEVGTALGTIE